jgi:hypothetical protein
MTRPRSKNEIRTDLCRPVFRPLALVLLLPLLAGCSPMPDEPPVHEPPPHQGMD